jgi:hypothetical protein
VQCADTVIITTHRTVSLLRHRREKSNAARLEGAGGVSRRPDFSQEKAQGITFFPAGSSRRP